jgi:colicin import membrane protein
MKSIFSPIVISTVLLFLGVNQPTIAQENKDKSNKVLKKEEIKKETQKETKKVKLKKEIDDVAGKTRDGRTVYAGPKGGFYYLTSNGNKIYIKETELIGAKIVGKTSDGKTIFEGPRGGRYYYNSNSEKTYLKKP